MCSVSRGTVLSVSCYVSELLVGRTDRVWMEEETDRETERKGGRRRCIQGLLGRWEFTSAPSSVHPGRGNTGGGGKKMFEEEKNCRRTDGWMDRAYL